MCAEKEIEKKVPKLDSNSVPCACEARALPSELQGGDNWAAHASMASIDYN